MGRWRDIKAFILIAIMTSFILSFSHFGPLAVNQALGETDTYAEGTMVASINVAGMTESEALNAIATSAAKWQEERKVTISLKHKEVLFDETFISFDIPNTLDQIKNGSQNTFLVDIQTSYYSYLETKLGKEISDHIQYNRLTSAIKSKAERLQQDPLMFSIYDFVQEDAIALYEVVSEYRLPLGQNYVSTIDAMLLKFDGSIIPAKESFSVIDTLNVKEISNIDNKHVHMIATALYGAVLDTNFSIKQRHISQRLPTFAELGKEASVDVKANNDFVFVNPNEHRYQLGAQIENNEIVIQIKGFPLPNRYQSTIENAQPVKPRTVVQFSNQVEEGNIYVKQKGIAGNIVEVYRLVENQNGLSEKDFISEDYYPPVNRIEVHYSEDGQTTIQQNEPENGATPSGNQANHDETPNQSTTGENGDNSEEDLPSEDNEQFWEEDEGGTAK